MQLSWKKVLIFTLIPFSDFIIRVFYMKGTVDKTWTLFPLFQIPPFTLAPLVLMKLGRIKTGNLTSPPYDIFVLLFLIFRLLIRASTTCDKYSVEFKFIYDVLGTLLAILTPLLIRYFHPKSKKCISVKNNKNALFKILGQSGILYFFMIFFIFMIPKTQPILQSVGEDILYFGFYLFGYTIINMYNENQIKKFCGFAKKSNYQLIIGIVLSFIASKILENKRYGQHKRIMQEVIPETQF